MGGRAKLWVVFGTVTVDFIGFGIIIPLLTRYAEDFGAGGIELGILLMSYSLMQMIFAPIWGQLSDHFGRRPVLLGSIAGNAVALAVAGFAPNFWVLLGARILSGVCTSNVAVAGAYIADVTVATERARGMGMLGAARGIGFVVGPIIGGLLARYGLEVPFLAASGLALLNLISAWWLLPETIHHYARKVRFTSSLRERWNLFGRTDEFRPLLWLGFVQVVAFAMLEMSFVLFIERRMNLSPIDTAVLSARVFTYIGIVMAVMQGIWLGRLVSVLGESRLVQAGLLLLAFGMLMLPATPPGDWAFFLVLTGLIALGQGSVAPTLTALISRQGDAGEQGGLLGVYHSVLALARVIGPLLAGLIFDFSGENGPYWVGGTLMVMALCFTFSRWGALDQFSELDEEPA